MSMDNEPYIKSYTELTKSFILSCFKDLMQLNRERAYKLPEHKYIYSRDMGASYLFKSTIFGEILNRIAKDLPRSISMNVCEIGAGTGGMTLHAAPVLK